MSDLFDEYPMLMFALEALIALFLLVFIVAWTASGKKKTAHQQHDRSHAATTAGTTVSAQPGDTSSASEPRKH